VRRGLAIAVVALAVLVAVPMSAHAVLSGENGRVVYISGSAFGATKLFLRSVTSSTGAGTKTGPLDTGLPDQHRHPTWSPDRTKIAFAEGAGGVFDIYVFDLTVPPSPGTNPQNITNTPAISEDRPAWSPDGTRIAFEDATDVFVRNLVFPFGTINMTSNITPKAWKAAWSPDSQTLYYGVGNIATMPNGNTNDVKLFQQAANAPLGGTEFLHVSGAHVFQPAISPDGTKMCFTISTEGNGLPTSANVLVVPVSAPTSPPTIITNSGVGDYNCTWSPDGFEIAYTEDFAGNGEVLMEESDGSGLFAPNLSDTPMAFDGNPDWAPDARPLCPDTTVTTNRNTPVTFQVNCEDTGPAYEQSDVREFNKTSPLNGTLTQEFAGDPFTYTPNQGFVGTDSFVVQSFDEFGFGADTGTVMITVKSPGGGGGGGGGGATAKCAGRTATIVGTTGADVLRGTGRRDVIAALGGNDRVRGGRGNDLICAGSGRDRVAAGSGGDRVLGGSGPDTLSGNSGNDRLSGGTGRDTLTGGSGRDRLNGGPSRDVCRGGLGRDAGSGCERRSSIP